VGLLFFVSFSVLPAVWWFGFGEMFLSAESKVVVAPAAESERNRPFQSAAGVWRTLEARSIFPRTLTVFTLGSHARRTRLVFEKVYQGKVQVGVMGWIPPDYKSEPWWRSSERARDLIVETAGYLYERLLNSGRASNSSVREDRENISQIQSIYGHFAPRSSGFLVQTLDLQLCLRIP
jgi:hypothetical protein